ncbi:MAG TPA: hypothetical protein VIQ11_07870 [Mycobacterium sp.]
MRDDGLLVVRGTLGSVEGKLVISEPKMDRSRRSVPIASPLVAMLRAHRVTQRVERDAAGDKWTDERWCSPPSSTRRWTTQHPPDHRDRSPEIGHR